MIYFISKRFLLLLHLPLTVALSYLQVYQQRYKSINLLALGQHSDYPMHWRDVNFNIPYESIMPRQLCRHGYPT